MQPLSHSTNSSGLGKCQETSTKCVVWDGPDINCLGVQLCKGQSIEVVMYHTAKTLCDLLDALNITNLDLACITPPAGTQSPQTQMELMQLIIAKLCELNDEVDALQNTGSALVMVDLPVCDSLPGLEDCPAGTTMTYEVPDPNGGPPITITKLVLIDPVTNTSPAANYFAEKICELLCRMTTAEDNITQLQLDVENLQNQISGALPSVNVPACISPIQTLPLADPTNANTGAVYEIAQVVCDIITNITGDPNGGDYPMGTDCPNNSGVSTDISALPPVGTYPGVVVNTLADLGAIPNPQYLYQTINNIMVAICDLRNFAKKVNDYCCPAPCNDVTIDIGAVIWNSTSRDTVRFFLNGQFQDEVTQNQVSASFANGFNTTTDLYPGYAINGPNLTPPQWDLHFPVTISICDTATPQNCIVPITNKYLDDFAAVNSYVDINTSSLDATTDYIVTYTVNVVAPDKTLCTFTDTTTLTTTCDNQKVTNIVISDIGANGITVTFVQPIVNPGTTLVSYTFTFTPSGGNPIEIENIAPGWETQGYLVYPDEESYAGSGVPPTFGTDQWVIQTLDPNQAYTLSIIAVYNCGQSTPENESFTTLAGITVEIDAINDAANCVGTQGTLQFVVPSPLPPGTSVSPNIYDPIIFNGQLTKSVTIGGSPGLQIGYTFQTLSLKSAPYSLTDSEVNCPLVSAVRCWGPPSLHKFPTLPPASLPILLDPTKMITNRQDMGCYDYIISNFSSSGISFAGAPSVTNINDGGGQGPNNDDVGTYQYTYSSTSNAITFPTTSGSLTIGNTLHPINNGNAPQIKIMIDDPDQYFVNNGLGWWPAGNYSPGTTIANVVTGFNNIVWNQIVQPTYPGATIKTWQTSGTYASPVPVPVFLRISVYKWTGSSYQAPIPLTLANVPTTVIDINPYWQNAPNIMGSGYTLPNSLNIGLRDKLVITYSGGVRNNNANTDYPQGNPAFIPLVTTELAATVTLTQDPYPVGTFPNVAPLNLQTGPYSTYANTPSAGLPSYLSYDDAISGVSFPIIRGVLDNFTYPAFSSNPSRIELVVSGDMTIKWEFRKL